jgi:AcrR family transcriptional regulator
VKLPTIKWGEMMDKKVVNTKELLIVSAGELFAEHGYDGVSTRMIAESAEVKLSAIHYHFGSKENLYVEAFTYAHEKGKSTNFADVIAENPVLTETALGQAEIIRNTVFRTINNYFKPERPEWETKILIRELANPTSALNILAEKFFKPNVESAIGFYKLIRPGTSDEEAAAWSDLLHSHVLFYSMAKQPIELVRGDKALNPEFFRTTARILARAMILEVGLPLPDDLK